MAETKYIPRLQEKYLNEVVPALKEKFNYKSVMQVPRLLKINLNQGVNGAVADKKLIDNALAEMATISGQQAVATRSKKDISNFKLRKGMPVGVKVTLRRTQMFEFLDRLISVSLPRVRDFKGISEKAFDGRGNYTLGITEQIIFPEIDYDKIDALRGMDITITTSARTDEEARALLTAFKFPLRNCFTATTFPFKSLNIESVSDNGRFQ